MNAPPPNPFDDRQSYRLGPAGHDRGWTVSTRGVSLVRGRNPGRTASIPADPARVTVDMDRTALIVIDMQNDFCDEAGWFSRHKGVDPSPARALFPVMDSLTAAASGAALPVIWVNWGVRPDRANLPPSVLFRGKRRSGDVGYGEKTGTRNSGALVAGGWGARVADGLTTRPSDLHVSKHRFSAFQDNELDSILRNLDVTTLLFAGINTDRCVFASLTHATFLGYDAILVADACATCSSSEVARSTVWLVQNLYGFVASEADVNTALSAAAPDIG